MRQYLNFLILKRIKHKLKGHNWQYNCESAFLRYNELYFLQKIKIHIYFNIILNDNFFFIILLFYFFDYDYYLQKLNTIDDNICINF